jgi:hypothetical protein
MSSYSHTQPYKDTIDRIKDRERNAALQNERFSSHASLSNLRTQEILRLRETDTSALAISGYQPPTQRTSRRDLDSQLMNSSRDVPAYDTLLGLSTKHQLSGTESLPSRLRGTSSLDRRTPARPLPRRGGSPSE